MGVHLDVEGDDELRRALQQAPEELMRDIEKATSKGSLNIKRDWSSHFEGSTHAPHLARAVNYDLDRQGYVVTSEIGIDKGRVQGPLGNLTEFGSINNAGDPAGQRALDDEEPRYEKAMADIAENSLSPK